MLYQNVKFFNIAFNSDSWKSNRKRNKKKQRNNTKNEARKFENIIATTKIRNNYGAIQSFIFPILQQQYWTFLYCPLHPFLYQFFVSFLKALSLKYRSSYYRDSDSCCSFSILKAIAKRLLLLFANAYKSV